MKFLKFTSKKENRSFVHFIPTENWNFCTASLVTVHAPENQDAEDFENFKVDQTFLVLETNSFVRDLQQVVKERKVNANGKVLTERFDYREVDSPYSITIMNEEEIAQFVAYFENNLVAITT